MPKLKKAYVQTDIWIVLHIPEWIRGLVVVLFFLTVVELVCWILYRAFIWEPTKYLLIAIFILWISKPIYTFRQYLLERIRGFFKLSLKDKIRIVAGVVLFTVVCAVILWITFSVFPDWLVSVFPNRSRSIFQGF